MGKYYALMMALILCVGCSTSNEKEKVAVGRAGQPVFQASEQVKEGQNLQPLEELYPPLPGEAQEGENFNLPYPSPGTSQETERKRIEAQRSFVPRRRQTE